MAADIVASLFKWTTDKLSSLVSVSASVNSPAHELQQLQFIMLRIQSTLDEAEERNVTYETDKLRLNELKQIAYDAEDAMDEYQCEVLRAMVEDKRPGNSSYNYKGKVRDILDHSIIEPLNIAVPVGFAQRVRVITEKFDEITREWAAVDLWQKSGKRRRRLRSWTRVETSSYFDTSSYFCREDEKQKVVSLLLSEVERNGDTLVVLPIFGMGGIGKTTLAQQVYSDPRVCQFFDARGWLCVSEKFDVIDLTQKIIMAINSDQRVDYIKDLQELHEILYEELQEKKLLLVLDDVWVEDSKLWESLREPLLDAKLSAVIVTTRNASTAEIMHTIAPYRVDVLAFEESWLLFGHIAFAGLDPHENANFIDLGLKIVEKCKGLPLAIKVLAGILQSKYDEEAWMDILESEVWELDQDEDQILPALRLSYDCMPPHLKRCFMYFSLFPKDYDFWDYEIINIWMSQGLLQQSGTIQLEDIGSDYLKYFLQRSILEELASSKRDRQFKMHDLIHDLAQSVSSDEFLRIDVSEVKTIPRNARHLSLVSNDNSSIIDLTPILESKVLRSVSVHGKLCSLHSNTTVGSILNEFFLRLRCIQALDLVFCNIQELPDSIGNLRRLRYLSLKTTEIRKLPETICNLYNLLILDLGYNYDLQELPRGIGQLFQLRQLKLHAPRLCMPSELRKLVNLQILTSLNIGHDGWHCGLSVLKELMNLRGELSIYGLGNARSSDVSFHETYLKAKSHLMFLILDWHNSTENCRHCSDNDNDIKVDATCDQYVDVDQGKQVMKEIVCSQMSAEELAEKVLGCLEPPTSLEYLQIQNYVGANFPKWMGDVSFTNIRTVCVDSFTKCKFLPPLGQLPSLRYIEIKGLTLVESVGPEFCSHKAGVKGFHCLQDLQFESMESWVEWSDMMDGEFPQLRKLTLMECPKLRKLPPCICSLQNELILSQCHSLMTVGSFPLLKVLKLHGKWSPQLLYSSALPMLQHLEVHQSEETLLLLNYQTQISLKVLKISQCWSLRSIVAPNNLTSLEVLKIYYCPQLQLSPDEQIPFTLKLKIRGSPQIENWQKIRVTKRTYQQ